jgi:hypothetical protein
MARWIPQTQGIESNEHVGRRLFDEPMLVGAKDQTSFKGLLSRHFEETRGDEFSVDRLGRTSIDKSVVRYIRPLADAAGKSFHAVKRFDGWAVLPAHRLAKAKGTPLPVIPSPLPDNPYHAHVLTADLLKSESENIRHYHIALHLRQVFIDHGTVHPAEIQKTTDAPRMRWISRFKNWASKHFSRR